MSTVLQYVKECRGVGPTPAGLRDWSSLGTNYVKAMPRYCNASGLLHGWEPTEFGNAVMDRDVAITSPVSQSLIHYHLSAPNGPGPEFWHFLITERLRPGTKYTTASIRDDLRDFSVARSGKEIAPRTATSTAGVFLNSYSKPEGLSGLGLITSAGNVFTVHLPSAPPSLAFGYALVDYWAHIWSNQRTVSLNEVTRPDGIAGIFFLSERQVEEILNDLKREGILDIYRSAPPYQVVRQWSDSDLSGILERAYDQS